LLWQYVSIVLADYYFKGEFLVYEDYYDYSNPFCPFNIKLLILTYFMLTLIHGWLL